MFGNLTLKSKLLGLGLLVSGTMVMMIVVGLLQLVGGMQSEKENIARLNADMDLVREISSMDIAYQYQAKSQKNVWMRGNDPEKYNKYRAAFLRHGEEFDKHLANSVDMLKKIGAMSAEPDGIIPWLNSIGIEPLPAGSRSGILDKMNALAAEHKSLHAKYLAQIDSHSSLNVESDLSVDGIDKPLLKMLEDARDEYLALVEEEGVKRAEVAVTNFRARRNFMMLLAFGSLGLLASVVSSTITSSILRQLGGDPKDVAQVVNTMASGNFSLQPGKTPYPGSLLENAYAMQGRLRDMIMAVKEQADHVESIAHSVASSAGQIAENVHHESDAMSSMASSIEEMSVSTTHISDQGGSAKRIAGESRNQAEQGAQVVGKTVAGLLATAREIENASGEVSRLGEDASRISDVVKTIKEIADQTNLLALNAAIEAARAGEQGRGFAVVADEVRKLAERTASATNEINEMSTKIGVVAGQALGGMGKVVETTRQGVADAEIAQGSIASIQQSFAEVAGVIDDISGALTEQNLAANELAKNTEQVAQMSEENSSAANGLLELAQDLEAKAAQVKEAVSVFRV